MPPDIHLDFSGTRFCGRQRELDILRDALLRTAKGGLEGHDTITTILLEGASGSGKTCLVEKFLAKYALDDTEILVCRGKFEQVGAFTEPFLAIDDALVSLFESLREKGNLQCLQEDSLSSDLDVLRIAFPRLGRYLDQTLRTRRRSSFESRVADEQRFSDSRRLQLSVLEIVRKISCGQRSVVVLFADDLQWAGEGAVDMLQTIAGPSALIEKTTDTPVQLLLLYSNRPVESTHPLMGLKKDLHVKLGDSVVEMRLSNSTVDDLSQFVSDLLRRERGEIKELVALLHKKTEGNIFLSVSIYPI